MRRILLAITAGLLVSLALGNSGEPFGLPFYWAQEVVAWLTPSWVSKEVYILILEATEVAFVVLPGVVVAVLLIAYRRPIPPNHCGKCGHNLKGNESGTCPECGAGAESK